MRGVSAALLALLVAGSAGAATVVDRLVEIDVQGSGYVRHERIMVQLDDPGDPGTWARFPIAVGGTAELLDCSAEVLDESGEVTAKVPRKRHERIESAGFGLYSSTWLDVVPFPPLHVGQRVRVEWTVREAPLFEAASVRLLRDEPQKALRVVVHGPAGLRYQVWGAEDGIAIKALGGGGVELSGHDLDGDDSRSFSPAYDLAGHPMLRIAWGNAASWPAVGEWYERLLAGVARGGASVRELAAQLTADAGTPRARLDTVIAYVKRQVRYEAVEIAEGGWVPTAPTEVLQRGWGDCKDKALLLADLLRAAGIPAHLVLIRAGEAGRLDAAFPSPYWFNHCIVAVPRAAVGDGPYDVAADGLVLLDPTVEDGDGGWLHLGCQGRQALVVDGSDSRLVEVPVRADLEGRLLDVSGAVSPTGELTGRASLVLTGDRALTWLRRMRTEPKAQIAEAVHRLMAAAIPGEALGDTGWARGEGDVPMVRLTADVHLAHAVRGSGTQRWVRLGALGTLPESRALDDRTDPVVLLPGVQLTRWSLSLPRGWTVSEDTPEDVTNALGSVRMQVRSDSDNTLHVEYRITVATDWVDAQQLPSLRELAVAQSRCGRRRVRIGNP